MAHIQTQYGGLWKPQDLALDKISSQKMFIDNIDFIESFIKEGKQKLHQSVKTIADLKAIDTSDTTLFTTGMLIMVYEIGIFYFNRNATGTDSSDIVTPTTGGGRWILIASSGSSDPITPESIGAAPSTHASQHATSGRDPITPASIGAATSGHTHNYAGSSSAGGSATSAVKLSTARTIRTNLGSTGTASFDGTSNVTPGVTGTLKVANGGTGATTAAAALQNLGITFGTSDLIAGESALETGKIYLCYE